MRIRGKIFSAQWVRRPWAHRDCGLPCSFFFFFFLITHLFCLAGDSFMFFLSLKIPVLRWKWTSFFRTLSRFLESPLQHPTGTLGQGAHLQGSPLLVFLRLLTRIFSLLLTIDHPAVWTQRTECQSWLGHVVAWLRASDFQILLDELNLNLNRYVVATGHQVRKNSFPVSWEDWG